MEKICPKCGRDYSNVRFWTTSLKRHLARKNPCNRDPNDKFVREQPRVIHRVFNPLDSVEWTPVRRPHGLHFHQITPWLFKEVFSNPKNTCFVFPNKSRNEIIVKLSADKPAVMISMNVFIKEFVNRVFLKHFSFEDERRFEIWLGQCSVSTRHMWTGTNGKKNDREFMVEMRRAVREVSGVQTDKVTLKNVLLQQLDTNDSI